MDKEELEELINLNNRLADDKPLVYGSLIALNHYYSKNSNQYENI